MSFSSGMRQLDNKRGLKGIEVQKERPEIVKFNIFTGVEPSTFSLTSQKKVSLSVI